MKNIKNNMKTDTKKNKEKLLIALKRTLGIVTPACEEAGISRNTFYKYYKNDLKFKEAVDEINEMTLDFVENQLLKKIKDGSERSILFYMKYKARKRGYTDSVDITSNGKDITEIKLIQVTRENKDGK